MTLHGAIMARLREFFTLMNGSPIEISVEPAKLLETAEQIRSNISFVQNRLEKINDTMINASSHWTGETYENRKSDLETSMEYMQEVNALMLSYSAKLEAIARNYINTENTNEEAAQALPVNVIS